MRRNLFYLAAIRSQIIHFQTRFLEVIWHGLTDEVMICPFSRIIFEPTTGCHFYQASSDNTGFQQKWEEIWSIFWTSSLSYNKSTVTSCVGVKRLWTWCWPGGEVHTKQHITHDFYCVVHNFRDLQLMYNDNQFGVMMCKYIHGVSCIMWFIIQWS